MIRISVKLTVLFSLLYGFSACSGDQILNREEYLDYFNAGKNKFLKEKEFNKVKYKLKLQLPEYLVLKNSDILSKEEYTAELAKNSGFIGFVLLIEDAEGSKQVKEVVYKPELFSKLTNYSNMQLADDIRLVCNNDTLACSVVHLEPASSIQPVIRMALAFENVKRGNSGYTLIFNDNLFNNGKIKFSYSSETFDDLPKLKF